MKHTKASTTQPSEPTQLELEGNNEISQITSKNQTHITHAFLLAHNNRPFENEMSTNGNYINYKQT